MCMWEAEPVELHSLPINKGVCVVRVVFEEVRNSHVGICQASKQVFYICLKWGQWGSRHSTLCKAADCIFPWGKRLIHKLFPGHSFLLPLSASPPHPSNQAAEACIWKNLETQQRNMWKVCLPRVWHLKNTSRIIPGVFHPQRSPCSCSLIHYTLCHSLTFLKAPFCPLSRGHALTPYKCPTFCLSKIVKVQSSQAGFCINLHLTLLVLFIPSQTEVHWKLRH